MFSREHGVGTPFFLAYKIHGFAWDPYLKLRYYDEVGGGSDPFGPKIDVSVLRSWETHFAENEQRRWMRASTLSEQTKNGCIDGFRENATHSVHPNGQSRLRRTWRVWRRHNTRRAD